LTGLITHFSTYTIRILDGNVEEILLACSLIMSHSSFAEMTEIVELMGEVFHPFPALGASPVVRVLRVLCTGSIEITVRFLTRSNDSNHAVHIFVQTPPLELGVGIGLQEVAGTLDGLVWVSVVEGEGALLDGKDFRRIFEVFRSIAEVGVTPCLLAL
jgi:hypothetical protein